MKPTRRAIAFSLLSVLLGAIAGLGGARNAAAQKLPVDCSGRKSECALIKNCYQWYDHVCYAYETRLWYWYY